MVGLKLLGSGMRVACDMTSPSANTNLNVVLFTVRVHQKTANENPQMHVFMH